jgi:hypothetical protein
VNRGITPDRRASTALTLSCRPKKQLCCDIFNEGNLNGKIPLKGQPVSSRAHDRHVPLTGSMTHCHLVSLKETNHFS